MTSNPYATPASSTAPQRSAESSLRFGYLCLAVAALLPMAACAQAMLLLVVFAGV